MSKIVAAGKAVPQYRHEQPSILEFMQRIYAFNEADKRKLRYLYSQSSIDTRYSVIPDYSRPLPEWKFYPHSENLEPFPSLELRMAQYNRYAAALSVDAIRDCLGAKYRADEITHLITVSCTGMSAPGLDLQVMELLDLPKNTFRTSVNFMGCYAAIHGLKIADALCSSTPGARVMIVCTELCTLHFQRESSLDNIASSLLFGDGSAAVMVTPDGDPGRGLHIDSFYSEVIPKGKKDMAWELSSTGFLMTLSGYVPELIEADFKRLVFRALAHAGSSRQSIAHWCIHPGGRKILDAIQKTIGIEAKQLNHSYDVLKEYGNMSSPTILFVLQRIMKDMSEVEDPGEVFAAAFGPGLTMETFIATWQNK